MNSHLIHLLDRRPELEVCQDEIGKVFLALSQCLRNGGKLLLCGNGGSASDAEHWAGELLKGFAQKRCQNKMASLPGHLRDKLQGALPAIPLTGFSALSTAFANDVDPQLVFAQLIWALGKPGDVLIGISTSGDAVNVLRCHGSGESEGYDKGWFNRSKRRTTSGFHRSMSSCSRL